MQRDADLIPGLGRSPEEGNGNSLQYSCLRNPIDRGAWWAADMSEQPTPYSLYARLQEQLLPYWNPLG